MNTLSAKNKIIVALLLWVVGSAVVFMYVFTMFDRSNEDLLKSMESQKKELFSLEAEYESYQKAQQDLETLEKKLLQPADFFSKDVTLVNEIRILENLAQRLQVSIVLSGVSGTTKSAPKAKTQSDIVAVPYGLNVSGPFSNVLSFVETLEHLSFITDVTSMSVSAGENGTVNISLAANFYLQK